MMRQFAECLASEMTGPAPAVEEPAAAEEPQAEAPQAEPPPRAGAGGPHSRPTPEVLDLADASRDAVLKRALPLVGGVLALLLIIRLIRR
jgi:uncharacterized protein